MYQIIPKKIAAVFDSKYFFPSAAIVGGILGLILGFSGHNVFIDEEAIRQAKAAYRAGVYRLVAVDPDLGLSAYPETSQGSDTLEGVITDEWHSKATTVGFYHIRVVAPNGDNYILGMITEKGDSPAVARIDGLDKRIGFGTPVSVSNLSQPALEYVKDKGNLSVRIDPSQVEVK